MFCAFAADIAEREAAGFLRRAVFFFGFAVVPAPVAFFAVFFVVLAFGAAGAGAGAFGAAAGAGAGALDISCFLWAILQRSANRKFNFFERE
jgi:hypothetical protein